MSSGVPVPENVTRVLIVEDQTAIRELLSSYIGAMPSFAVVGHAGSAEEGLRILRERKPTVVVLDWMLLGGIGLQFLKGIKGQNNVHVLVFSANTTELAVREALDAGAKGYIEKTASFSEFTGALKAVAHGGTYLGPAVSRALQRLVRGPDKHSPDVNLSPRERDVLRAIAEGLTSKEIADSLGLSVRTVENHRANITKRTGMRSVAQLVLHAVRLGLVEAPGIGSGSEAAESGA